MLHSLLLKLGQMDTWVQYDGYVLYVRYCVCWQAATSSGKSGPGALCAGRPMRAPHRHRIGRLAAWTAILNGQQAQAAIDAFARNRVMATLAIDRIGRSELPACLADMEQRAARTGGCATGIRRAADATAPKRIMAVVAAGHRPGRSGISASRERIVL